jgi:hypothetical protein
MALPSIFKVAKPPTYKVAKPPTYKVAKPPIYKVAKPPTGTLLTSTSLVPICNPIRVVLNKAQNGIVYCLVN